MHVENPDLAAHIVGAVVLGALGVAQLLWPSCFVDATGFLKLARRKLPDADRERVSRAMDARSKAERVSSAYGRYVGLVGIALAGLALIPGVSFVLPYALFCLATAVSVALAYVHVQRSQRRTAVLRQRSPLEALPLPTLAAVAVCLAGTIPFVLYEPYRAPALAVAAASVLLAVIAWRIAVAPALLFGDDPAAEYAIDRRIRICRATSIASLACAPPAVLALLTNPADPQIARLFDIAAIVMCGACVVAVVMSLVPAMRRLTLA